MPLISTPLLKIKKNSLVRSINKLIRNEVIPIEKDHLKSLKIGAVLDIHLIHANEITSMKFGKPEGMRVLLINQEEVIAILDFFYSGKRLVFSYALVGNNVKGFVTILKQIENEYHLKNKPYEVAYLHFLLNPHPYIMVNDSGSSIYFRFKDEKISKISKPKLQSELKQLIKTRHQI